MFTLVSGHPNDMGIVWCFSIIGKRRYKKASLRMLKMLLHILHFQFVIVFVVKQTITKIVLIHTIHFVPLFFRNINAQYPRYVSSTSHHLFEVSRTTYSNNHFFIFCIIELENDFFHSVKRVKTNRTQKKHKHNTTTHNDDNY